MTSIKEQNCFVQKSQVSKAPTNRSNNRNHKGPLGLNKPGFSKAITRLEALAGLLQVPPPLKTLDVI